MNASGPVLEMFLVARVSEEHKAGRVGDGRFNNALNTAAVIINS
jgi:hypothetical protein